MRKLGRKKSNREHLIKNLAASLVLYETVDTTESKAKEVKSYLEKILARNKEADLVTKRNLISTFFDRNAAKKIIEELMPRYEKRNSGFIRSFHLKNRLGDNAPMMRLELVDKKVFVEAKAEAKAEVKEETKETKKASKAEAKSEATVTVKTKGKK